MVGPDEQSGASGGVRANDVLINVLTIVAIVAVAVGVAWPVDLVVRRLSRRYRWLGNLSRRARRPFRFLVGTVAAFVAVTMVLPTGTSGALPRYLLILIIVAAGWLLTSLLFVIEEGALPRL